MEKLGINLVQLGAQLINVGILVLILKKFLYKPVFQLLQKRQRIIEDGIRKQEEMEKKLALLDAKEKDLDQTTRKKESELVKTATDQAKQTADQLLKDARKQADEIIKSAKEEKQRAIALALEDQNRELTAKAVELANQALSKFLDPDVRVKITQSQIQPLLRAKE